MTKLSGKRTFVPTDRIFKLIEYMCVFLDMQIYALCASHGLPLKPPLQNHYATLISRVFPVHVRHPVFGPFWGSFQKANLVSYDITFAPSDNPTFVRNFTSDKMGTVADMVWNTALVFFYEQNRPWIQDTFGSGPKDRDKWPEIFRFAWALRNAAAHHHGALNITDKTVPPVVWHHLSYDYRNVGLRVFGEIMSPADMLIFIIEMSDELDRLGCPHP